jgi:hypothetical protein
LPSKAFANTKIEVILDHQTFTRPLYDEIGIHQNAMPDLRTPAESFLVKEFYPTDDGDVIALGLWFSLIEGLESRNLFHTEMGL